MINLLYSLISFFVAVFFIMLGVIGVLVPWLPGVRTDLVQFLLEDSIAIILFGFSFIAIGLGIVVSILLGVKKEYYSIKVNANPVAIDEIIIQHYLNAYWKETFPGYEIPNRLVLKHNKIHVVADLPYMHSQQQEIILERIKNDLRGIFGKLLGYHQHFYLTASFQSDKQP